MTLTVYQIIALLTAATHKRNQKYVLSLTHTAHVHARGRMQNHARAYDHARGRPWTHVAAVARNNANYADTAELDLSVRARACTCVCAV